ncbi:hydroxymethylglutaryl-CoA lyase [Marinimicrobium sp. ABcell2]|uniref:hydroxymethylglutaryl-CoA lyase n=1 Tax=Marinimicrobium sp. ABcell2 TaxID=3069751 RepID=UPI0027B54EFA|nr:hydroxymethylglutaryl-CoA lyase [Marinimicrobium sp. ABcell2]MDQ2076457.1 hydroxymethylglutaryl-CoA lyase [Marinimicrobium sp. ABcell2]
MTTAFPKRVRLVEVGPRDGLQNQARRLTTGQKIRLIEGLAQAGLDYLEAGSFVNPKWVPQMADSDQVLRGLHRQPGVTYAALTPNLKGFERALDAGATEVAVFAAASEAFSQKNINCSISESLTRFEPVMEAARAANLPVRGYISCVVGCPYSGDVAPAQVHSLAEQLLAMGCREVSLGDTIGVGTAGHVDRLLSQLTKTLAPNDLAVHMHDTYGQALTNIYVSLGWGISVVDSAIAGLGGCPYAPGAAGNVATEDVVYLLDGLGIEHGTNLEQLVALGEDICAQLGCQNQSRVGRALHSMENQP